MAETITKITTHEQDAVDRLLQHLKGKDKLEGIIRSLGVQFQDLEDVTFELIAGRAISTAVGKQLDQIGTIVDLTREAGQSDERYRTLLFVKIGQNTSQGTAEKIISVYKLLTEADVVFYQNLTRASILLAVDRDIDPTNDIETVQVVYDSVQKLVAAGVRVDYLICFSPDEDAFAFDGPNINAPALGFGNLNNANAGGKFARIHRLKIPFAFDGVSVNARGFGSIKDPLTGGTLVKT